MLAKFLRDQVVRVLRVDAGAIEPERPLSELGLDSLTSFELKNRIEAELAVSLPAGKFLQRPTLASLSEAILERIEAGAETAGEASREATGAADAHPLSARQEWLWHIYRRTPEATAFRRDYELGFAIAVRPRLDVQRLARAFDEVVARHPALRTSFPVGDGGGPVQRIAERHALGLEEVDATALDEDAFRTALAGC